MTDYQLYHGNCLEVSEKIEPGSIDLILADPPYGTTVCKWDTVIPFDDMWRMIWRLARPHAPVLLFCTQPYTSALIMSQAEYFKFSFVWDKCVGRGHLVAKIRPMQQTEDIAVFGRGKIPYYPIMEPRPRPIQKSNREYTTETVGFSQVGEYRATYTHKFPTNLLQFFWNPFHSRHPTEKPVELLSYLICTYSRPGDTVLDFCSGSCSTGVACLENRRKFIGIELDPDYYQAGYRRMLETEKRLADLGVVQPSEDLPEKLRAAGLPHQSRSLFELIAD